MRRPAWVRLLALVILLGPTVGACSGSDEEEPTDTPAPLQTVQSSPSPTQAPPVVGGSLVTDGICQVAIPDDWTDEGTARGRTSTNARWTLFGNLLGSDTEWTTAVTLLKNQQGGRPGAVVDESPARVVVTQAGNRAMVVRQRFPDRYCEMSLSAAADVPPETLALWTQVAAGLQPAAST